MEALSICPTVMVFVAGSYIVPLVIMSNEIVGLWMA